METKDRDKKFIGVSATTPSTISFTEKNFKSFDYIKSKSTGASIELGKAMNKSKTSFILEKCSGKIDIKDTFCLDFERMLSL